MTLQKTLSITSALILLYCAFTFFTSLIGATAHGVHSDPLFLASVGTLLFALTVTFVTSYRQIFRQYPRLVLLALCLIILSKCLMWYTLQSVMKDPVMFDLLNAKNDSIREGLSNGTIPKGQGFEEQLTDSTFTGMDLFKSISFYCLLFIVPLYTNFRNPAALINP